MRILLVVILLCAAQISLSGDREPLPDIFYQRIIQPLIPEVEELTRLPTPLSPPVIYVASRADIESLYCNSDDPRCAVAAITDDQGEITLSRDLLMPNLITVSVVFHELVHWSQIKNRLFDDEADCPHWAKSEMHAYTAQSRFLALHGGQAFPVPDLLSKC